MAAEQLDCAVDDLGAHGGFCQIGDPEDEGAARLKAIQGGSGAQVVGLAGFGVGLGEGFNNLAEMRAAAAGKNALLHGAAVDEQSDAIAGVESQLGHGHRGGTGVVELGVTEPAGIGWGGRGSALQQPAGVEDDPDGLAALRLILAGDELAAASGRGPADVAQVVALKILAEALEVASEAALAHLAQLEIDLAAAGEEDLLVFALAQGRIDAHGLLERRHGPTLDEPERRSIAHKERSGRRIAALAGLDAIA